MKYINMQKFFALTFLFITPLFVFAFEVPSKPPSYVGDFANLFSSEDRLVLENTLNNFEQETTNEVVVVTIANLDGEPIENIAQEIFTQWGIGKKDKNNGVLVLVALADRKTRIQVGYGIESKLTDLASSYIQKDLMTPSFREGKYYEGIKLSVDAIIKSLGGEEVVPENFTKNNKSKIPWDFLFIFAIFIFQAILSILARSKSFWGGGVLGGVIGGIIWYFGVLPFVFSIIVFVGLIVFGGILDFIVSRAYASGKFKGGTGGFWGGGGFGGGGSSGGGFGGFGGGGSGGGGSSGSW